jgi:hypothetical protein
MRQRIGVVRFQIHQAGYQPSATALQNAMGEKDFDAAWGQRCQIEKACRLEDHDRYESLSRLERNHDQVGLLVRIDPKPDKVDEVEAMLTAASRRVEKEEGTTIWLALRELDKVLST